MGESSLKTILIGGRLNKSSKLSCCGNKSVKLGKPKLDITVGFVKHARVLSHERILKAECSMLKLIQENTLFKYLDNELTTDFIVASTNNRIECGINSRLREILINLEVYQ